VKGLAAEAPEEKDSAAAEQREKHRLHAEQQGKDHLLGSAAAVAAVAFKAM
jgi:hypothetical protein